MHTHALLCPFLILLSACGDPPPVAMPAEPPAPFVVVNPDAAVSAPGVPVLIGNAQQAEAALGERVRVMGTAGDAKLSAVVQSEELLVYCMGKGAEEMLVESRWPEELLGQPVAVTGTLERSDQFMAVTEPDGAISEGTEAPILALVDYTHELVVPVEVEEVVAVEALPEVEVEAEVPVE